MGPLPLRMANAFARSLSLLCALLLGTVAQADTGDVLDDMLAAGVGVYFCPISAGPANVGLVWADVDADGTYDTQVVMTTLTGEAIVEADPSGGLRYFHSFIDAHCGGTPPYDDERGRFRIHFVDILAPGFVWNDPATWTYTAVPAARLSLSHDMCFNYGHPRYDDPAVHPEHIARAYREHGQTGPVAHDTNGSIFAFADAAGIKEINVTTDHCENLMDDLILCDSTSSANCMVVPPEEPGLALLFDTSGSMNWHFDGTPGVPVDERRLTLAKRAAIPMLDILGDHGDGTARLGLARFPEQPWSPASGCNGQVVADMATVSAGGIAAAEATINGLSAAGNTPLIAGLAASRGMFTDEGARAIVLLSDGYHNCPAPVGVSDPEVVDAINAAVASGVRIYTIGFARPSDVDHPLLQALAAETGGAFYDVTVPGFDAAAWDPATALAEAYAAILGDALGLETSDDPLGVIAPGDTVTREIPVSAADRAVTFYISWRTPRAGQLGLTIRSADGRPVPLRARGISVHDGPTYRIVTVHAPFLRLPGKVGEKPWQLQIDTEAMQGAEEEPYQYTVLLDSPVRMAAQIAPRAPRVGEPVMLTARLTANDRPIRGATVTARITRPAEGFGNWLGALSAEAAKLEPQWPKDEGEAPVPLQSRVRQIVDTGLARMPAMLAPVTVTLRDDGTGGDATADDGIYTAAYDDLRADGTYMVRFSATGTVGDGAAFRREALRHTRATVAPVAGKTEIELAGRLIDPGRLRVVATITPRDAEGNLLGPRQAGLVRVQPDWGRTVGPVTDNLDGSYSQAIDLPAGLTKPVGIDVRIGDMRARAAWRGLGTMPGFDPGIRPRPVEIGPGGGLRVPFDPALHGRPAP